MILLNYSLVLLLHVSTVISDGWDDYEGYKSHKENRLYDRFNGKPIDHKKRESYRSANNIDVCTVDIKPCDKYEPARVDGTCNNIKHPTRGAILTPFRRLLPAHYGPGNEVRRANDGSELPLVRRVRTTLFPDGLGVKFHDLTALFTHFFVATIVDVVTLIDLAVYTILLPSCCEPVSRKVNPLCLPVDVPDNDPYLRLTDIRCLNLTRHLSFQDYGCVSNSVPRERANVATNIIDMSMVYGYTRLSSNRTRQYRNGLLRDETRNNYQYPPGNAPQCINNQLPFERNCYEYGAPIEGNILPGINIITLWHYRQHNHIARELAKMNPCWSDEKLFNTARRINIALYQQIYYYEMLPIILGREYALENGIIFPTSGHVNDYNPHLEPLISHEALVGLRYYHGIQDTRTNYYSPRGKYIDTLSQVELILRTGALEVNNTIERITQGSFRQPSGRLDETMDRDLGERFTGNLNRAADLISIDIMRGRDVGLQSYNKYRKLCGLPAAKHFKDFEDVISRDKVELLSNLYNEPDDVDFMVGIYAERVIPGTHVGRTLRCIISEQYRHYRRSDRFWFEHDKEPGSFTEKQLLEIRKSTIAGLACQYAEEVKEIQPHAFYYRSHDNPITECSCIPKTDLKPWYDKRCDAKYSNKKNYQSLDDYY